MRHRTMMARPNFVKIGSVLRSLSPTIDRTIVHTGQHYDARMSEVFFAELGLPVPDVDLGIGSGTHAEQTARVMVAFERQLLQSPTDAVVVVGDVNSTLAAALVATKRGVPVAHIEAGLRSADWAMPEEVNRVLTDRMSRWLFTPSIDANRNLLNEGIDEQRIHLVGNVMIDTLLAHQEEAAARLLQLRHDFDLVDRAYAVLTLHRPTNVDDSSGLLRLLSALEAIGAGEGCDSLPILFPVHPRTQDRLSSAGWKPRRDSSIRVTEPMSYITFLAFLTGASLVMTDSGGLQEETSVLGVPCLTLRESTERPITCELGTNRIVGTDPRAIAAAASEALAARWAPARIPLWDGLAGGRIAAQLLADLPG